MKKNIITSISFAFFLVLLLLSITLFNSQTTDAPAFVPTPSPTASPSPTPSPTPQPTPIVSTVKFSATGDNLIHNIIYETAARKAQEAGEGEKYNFDFCYAQMSDFYQGFDLNWINQETLVNNVFKPSSYPQFSTPSEIAHSLYDVNMRIFALSNNHTYDKYGDGVKATLDFWQTMPEDVVTTGLWANGEDLEIPVNEVNGITFAYLAYTHSTNGIPHPAAAPKRIIYTSETERIKAQVEHARTIADFVVVGVHWGNEDSHTVHSSQEQLAQNLADWGADLVIGTHPHVLQDAEWLTCEDGREVFVCYSLGNFISAQSKAPNLVGGIMEITFVKTEELDGSVTLSTEKPYIHPIVTHYGGGHPYSVAYLYQDYTEELAAIHNVRAKDSRFTYDFITETIKNNIKPEYLTQDVQSLLNKSN